MTSAFDPSVHTADTHGTTFAFGVKGLGTGGFTVAAFHGKEAISRLFSFDVDVVVDDADRAATAIGLLGQVAWLTLDHPSAPRTIEGIIAEAGAGAALTQGRGTIRLRLVPRMWLLRRRRTSRIFQDLSVVEIIDAILAEHGVERVFRLTRTPPVRAYTVQYHETDYAFVTRLCAEEGIAFSFEVKPIGEPTGATVVFFDEASLVPPIDGGETLAFREDSPALVPEEHHVQELHLSRAIKSTRVTLREYDFRRPLVDLRAMAAAGEPVGPLDVYDHDGDDQDIEATESKAKIHLEQRRRRAQSAEGKTICRRLAPGRRFVLADHELGALNQPHLITAIEHTGMGVGGAGHDQGGDKRYRARFRVVPLTANARPKRPKRVLRQVVETATVTGPLGSEIHTDEHGRVRVQFHWDRGETRTVNAPAHSSCWIRVAQTWSGAAWGFQFVPRVGMEVLVAFLDGDVDRPVIIGCLPNAANPPPYPLPAGAAKSGIRTRSTPGGGGYNEIAFDDTAGAEALTLRGEKDLVLETKDEHRLVIGGDRKTTVSGNDSVQVRGQRVTAVDGDARDEVTGSAEQLVYGNQNVEVMGSRTTWVEAHDTTTARGNLVRTVSGDIALAAEGNIILTSGTADMGEVSINVAGNYVAGASQQMRLMAQQSLRLACGDSVITLTPEGITLEGVNIKLKGSKGVSAEGAGPALSLGDEAQLVAKTIKMYSESARIEMDKEASIKGDKIKLGGNSPDPEQKKDEQKAETESIEVRYLDEHGEAYAGKKYRVSVDGKVLEGTTDADGQIEVEIPKEARVAEVRLWIDEYPTGRVRAYVIDLDREFPEPDTPHGAKARLKNLGFFGGVVDDTQDGLDDALKLFQEAREIEVTGKLDAATVGELKKAHGH